MPDPTVRALDLQAGQAQIVELNPQGAQIVSGRDGIQVIKGSERQFNTISINLDPRYSIAPLMDVRVRQAINYAINRSALVQYVLLGYGDPAIGPTPSSIANAWNESLKVYPFNSDDAKAKQLLTEAGYPNGFNVKILTAEFNPNFLQVTEVVAADLKKVGINATIDQESFSTAATLLLSGNQTWSMAFHDWGGNLPTAYAVMGQFFNPADIGYFNWNLQHVNDSVLQTDLNQLQAADASQVLAISSRIEARIINQAYGALLYYPQVLAGATSNVHGFGIPPSPWWGYAIFMPEIGAEVWLSSGTSSSSMASFPPTAFPVVPLVSSVLILLYLVSPLKDSIFRFGKRRNDV